MSHDDIIHKHLAERDGTDVRAIVGGSIGFVVCLICFVLVCRYERGPGIFWKDLILAPDRN